MATRSQNTVAVIPASFHPVVAILHSIRRHSILLSSQVLQNTTEAAAFFVELKCHIAQAISGQRTLPTILDGLSWLLCCPMLAYDMCYLDKAHLNSGRVPVWPLHFSD